MPIEILMPALSPTMTEGNLAKWVKKEGDKVGPGNVIAEIETDKATMEVEAVDEGVIGKILVKEGTQGVKVNEVIALLLEEGESADAIKNYKPKKEEAPKAVAEAPAGAEKNKAVTPAPAAAPAGAGFTPPPVFVPTSQPIVQSSGKRDIRISPLARRLALEAGIAPENLSGTGPKGRIIKEDVEEAVRSGGRGGKVVRQAQEYTAVPNDMMRKTIATRLLQSKQHVPHFYLTVDCQIDKLLEVRQDLNDAAPLDASGKPAYKLSVNDLIIKAVAKGLKKIPQANASWTQDAIILYNNVDISVAVATEGGLITPIVRNADAKSLPAISNEMKELAKRAREGKLKPEEFQGGGFSISNLGMYGIKDFSAIINPPQGCILAVGAGEERAVVKNGAVVAATVMSVTLSCDHRVVDGAVGAEFLSAFKGFIEKPVLLVA